MDFDGARVEAPGWPGLRRADHLDAAFVDLAAALRLVQDQITAAAPPDVVLRAATRTLRRLATDLEPYQVDEDRQVSGKLQDVPGRAQALIPLFVVDSANERRLTGTVTFRRYHLGGRGAVHGGVLPLLFDDLLGRVANAERSAARTAYLHVDFRNITPVGRELTLAAEMVTEVGRKRYVRGTLHDGDVLCAEAEGLFVALRGDQS